MTTLHFKNKELVPTVNFLTSLELKNKKSRNRSKLVNLMLDVIKEYQKDLDKLSDDYSLKDEDGNVVPSENGSGNKIIPGKEAEYTNQFNELQNEVVTIDGGVYVSNIDALYSDLLTVDKSLSEQEAVVYDRLLDEYETNDSFKGDN